MDERGGTVFIAPTASYVPSGRLVDPATSTFFVHWEGWAGSQLLHLSPLRTCTSAASPAPCGRAAASPARDARPPAAKAAAREGSCPLSAMRSQTSRRRHHPQQRLAPACGHTRAPPRSVHGRSPPGGRARSYRPSPDPLQHEWPDAAGFLHSPPIRSRGQLAQTWPEEGKRIEIRGRLVAWASVLTPAAAAMRYLSARTRNPLLPCRMWGFVKPASESSERSPGSV